jgi:hypothetical protein
VRDLRDRPVEASCLALDGLVVPLTLRTNCKAAAWTSSSVALGSKLCSVWIDRHMPQVWQEVPTSATVGYGRLDGPAT